jgi:hypothetical protein
MLVRQREQEIDAIIRELVGRFGDRVPNEHIAAEAQEAYDRLCMTSKVDAFIPILALRRARDRVRLLAERIDAAVASVHAPPGPCVDASELVDRVDDRVSVSHNARPAYASGAGG